MIDFIKVGDDIFKAAYRVRNSCGRGLREKFYEAALAYELTELGHQVDRQVAVPVIYKGVVIDESYLADIIVDNEIIIEVKALTVMKENESRQLYNYLRLSDKRLGYLINFGAQHFKPGRLFEEKPPYTNAIYRIVNKMPENPFKQDC